MIITSAGNSQKLARTVAKALHATFSPLAISAFPDGDTYLRFNASVKGKTVVILNSFQPDSEKALLHTIFAAETAKDLGARKVILVAPYLAYLRQDKRFHPGEAVSSKIMGKHLSSCVDKVITIDPHLHRYRSLQEVFSCGGKVLTANDLIAGYIQQHVKNPVLVGPDRESSQWAAHIARSIGAASTILEKKRYSSFHVEVRMLNPIPLRGRNVVIVDDIISTGHTIVEAAKTLRKAGAKSITAIAVHGVFVNDALKKMKRAGVNSIITTNCIEHPTNKIDVSGLIVEELRKEKR